MNKLFWKRSVSLGLALVLLLLTAPLKASAFTLVQLKGTDVTLDETSFPYTGEEIRPNVTVKVNDQLLTLDRDYRVSYENNIEVGEAKVIVTGIGTASTTVGYTGTVEIPFQIIPKAPDFTMIQLKGTDVTIEGTSFPYTGSPIEPAVTVTVEGKTLVKDQDYRVSYRSNVEPGTAAVTVTGIGTASETVGYTGTVEIGFTITRPALYTLKGTDVTIEGTSFPYTGSYITPAVTVQVNGEYLVAGKHFTLSYFNNLGAGTATASVNGIEEAGYTGQVNIDFTITPDQVPEETKPEDDTTGKPEGNPETKPESPETKPETPETQPEGKPEGSPEQDPETKPQPVSYKLTKGDKATWYKESAKALSFTADGRFSDFEGIQIDGKNLDKLYYTAKDGTTVTLKSAFLQKLDLGRHTITIVFADGQAEGSFRVAAGLDATNPETSDSFRMGLWMTMMGLSLAGVSALFVLRKKIF